MQIRNELQLQLQVGAESSPAPWTVDRNPSTLEPRPYATKLQPLDAKPGRYVRLQTKRKLQLQA